MLVIVVSWLYLVLERVLLLVVFYKFIIRQQQHHTCQPNPWLVVGVFMTGTYHHESWRVIRQKRKQNEPDGTTYLLYVLHEVFLKSNVRTKICRKLMKDFGQRHIDDCPPIPVCTRQNVTNPATASTCCYNYFQYHHHVAFLTIPTTYAYILLVRGTSTQQQQQQQ